MVMQSSEKAFADLKALGAAAGVTKSVFQHVSSAALEALTQETDAKRPQAARKTLTHAVVASLSESGDFLKTATTSRLFKNVRADSTVDGRGFICDPAFGYVSKPITDASMMMESIREKDPKFFEAIISRIQASAQNMAALQKLSAANFEMRGKEIFDGNVTAAQISQWVAGNAKPMLDSELPQFTAVARSPKM